MILLGMSKQEDIHRLEKCLEKRGNLITKLEYQRMPKLKENSIEIRSA